MKKFYSTLLLVMAMLCTGANTALAGNVELDADEFKYALEEIGKSNITSLAFVDYGKEYFENNGYTCVDFGGAAYLGDIKVFVKEAGCYYVTPINQGDVITATWNCPYLFSNLTELTNIDLTNFNTENVQSMFSMFSFSSKLTTLNLSSFSTSNVKEMEGMFFGCSNLKSITFGNNFDTSNVKSMYNMFKDCKSLETLDLSSFNTAKVTDMQYMFYQCEKLTSLDLSSFNTSSVTNMGNMIVDCTDLTSLTIGNFDMQKTAEYANLLNSTNLNTLTMKALPYLANNTFNTKFSGEGKTVKYELDDKSVVYTGTKTNNLPAATTAPAYTREMSNEWGTVVVPFDITYSQSNGNYKLYKLTDVNASVNAESDMTFTEYENGNIPAGTPMAIKAVGSKNSNNKYEVTLTAGSNAISTTITPADQVDALQMTGTYTETKIGGGSVVNNPYFIANNQFWRADAETTVSPFRAWFERVYGNDSDEGSIFANVLNIVVADEADGIKAVNSEQLTVNNGKFIENGKVVVVKNGKKFNVNGQRVK